MKTFKNGTIYPPTSPDVVNIQKLQNDLVIGKVKQENECLLELTHQVLGRKITPDDYKDFQIVSGAGMCQAIVYKGERVGEIKSEITFSPNWDSFTDNSVTCTCITTFKLL